MITYQYDNTNEPYGKTYDIPYEDYVFIDANGSTKGIHYIQNVSGTPLELATHAVNSAFEGIRLEPNTVMRVNGITDLYVKVSGNQYWPAKIMVMGSQF